MKNLARLSALALSSALAMSPVLAQCGSKCASRCKGRCAAGSTKCGAKCGVKNSPSLIQRPAGYTPIYSAENSVMVAAGDKLFKNNKLSSNGLACASCHTGGAGFTGGFAKPFPHMMQMAMANYDVDQIYADEAVQICMVGPMASKPLNWDSADLQNLSAYVMSEQLRFAKK